ncbi:DUF6801 domain-containing protein [Actinacidiphila acidipaludis]|uniref:DUF6801 domain-containing protein n=1 Tax=Actinacidiphila acidipaludis TaxID=2873382 RepID=UPI0027DF604E|nr:DUF6801 domain-containing protein [Streptomyces acidipaludis]
MRPRRSVRFAAVATAALVAGALPGTNSAASGGRGELSLAYACQFASGEQDVTIAFTQRFPQTATAGKPIQPGDLAMAVTIPRAGVTAMLPAATASVSAESDLTAHITQGSSDADADWSGLTAPETSLAGTDDVVLTLTGKAPAVTVTASGDVAFSVGVLTLTLHPRAAAAGTPTTPAPGPTTARAAGTATAAATDTNATTADGTTANGTASDGTTADGTTASGAAAAGDVTGTCTPEPGQDAVLATVHVPGPTGTTLPGHSAAAGPVAGRGGRSTGHASGADGTASGSSGPSAAAGRAGGTIVPLDQPVHSGVSTCGKTPIAPLDPRRLPPVSDTGIVVPMPGQPAFPPGPMCGFAVGFSNVNKLNGAMIINDPHAKPVLAEVNSGQRKVLDYSKQYVEVDSIIDLRLPPSASTFLTFGFMPTTADVEFIPRGVFTVVQTGDDFFGEPILTTIGGYQDIRIHNVRINGTPLDVGPDCHTAKPLDIVLHGRKDSGLPDDDGKPDYFIDAGGPLTDEDLVIPPFTGCASHGENLDALFTAALSGPGNSLNISQGPLCDPINVPESCLPEIPIPQLPQRKKS